jgi:hypothetical protein
LTAPDLGVGAVVEIFDADHEPSTGQTATPAPRYAECRCADRPMTSARTGPLSYRCRVNAAVCPAHVDDPVLRNHIVTHASETYCSYCTVEAAAQPVAILLDRFMVAFRVGVCLLYQPNTEPATPLLTAADVAREIAQLAGIEHHGLIGDIASALAETPHWIPRDSNHGSHVEQLAYSWETFKRLVKHEMRFFFANRITGRGATGDMTAEQLLAAVSDVGQHTPEVWPVACPVPLYRARMATSETAAAQWRSAADLGSPPPQRAAANRMSPAGISIFYGATDRATAIAEAGSRSSDRYVVTGEFGPTREIELIDLTNLPPLPSPFDAAHKTQYFALRFLRKFVHDITLPVEIDGIERIEYVPTQVFTEYLRYAFPGGVDGLMFRSTQGQGNNVVLFFGPDHCADKGTETTTTRLTLDPSTVRTSRVMTVAR